MLWMARRTHRYVNLPLAGATLAVLVGLVAGWVVLAGVAEPGRRVRDGPYAAALATAQARVAGFDAKAKSPHADQARVAAAPSRRPGRARPQVQDRSSAAPELPDTDLRWADYAARAPALRAARRRRPVGAGGGRRDHTGRHRAGQHDPTVQRLRHSATHDLLSRQRRDLRPSRRPPVAGSSSPAPSALLLGLLAAAASWWGVSPAAAGVPMRRRLPAAMAGAVACLIALATVRRLRSGAYAPTRVANAGRAPGHRQPRARPRPPRPRPARRSPRPTACSPTHPPGALPAPGDMPPAARWSGSASAAGSSPASRPTRSCSAPATRSPARSRASTSTCCTPSRRRSSATPTRSSCG